MKKYCYDHSINYTSDNCPRCCAENRHNELINATYASAEHIRYNESNPGTYKCPSCLYIALLHYASRCPKCHDDISSDYWEEIDREESEKRLKNEKKKKIEEELEKKKRLEEIEKQRIEEEKITPFKVLFGAYLIVFYGVGAIFILGVILLIIDFIQTVF